jgi:hypothetical protein
MNKGHLEPYLVEMRRWLREAGVSVADKRILVTSGRVRVGYRIGETPFDRADPSSFRGVLHIIGERPGTIASRLFGLHNRGTRQHLGAEEDRSRHQKAGEQCRRHRLATGGSRKRDPDDHSRDRRRERERQPAARDLKWRSRTAAARMRDCPCTATHGERDRRAGCLIYVKAGRQ